MPFIDSKVSVKTTAEQQKELKTRLGQAIAIIPGKSESWLMVNLEDDQKMYFRGDDSQPLAFIWMRGSGTEPVFRIMCDVCGDNPQKEHYLLDWLTTMLKESDK